MAKRNGVTTWNLGRDDVSLRCRVPDDSLPAGTATYDPNFYLRKAAHWAHAYITAAQRRCRYREDLYDVSGLAHFELVRAIAEAGYPGGLERRPPTWLPICENNWKTPLHRGIPTRLVLGLPRIPTTRPRTEPDFR